MADFVSPGFGGRRQVSAAMADRVPPGQHVEAGFPVLTAGPTPDVSPDKEWSLRIDGMVGEEREWDWRTFAELPFEDIPVTSTA